MSKGEHVCSLHEFGDANSKAYCAVFIFVTESNCIFNAELLATKTIVAPLKAQSNSRLELMSGRIIAIKE